MSGIDYFKSDNDKQRFRALSLCICLESAINELISALSVLPDIPRGLTVRFLDHAQQDVEIIGNIVNTHKGLIHHRHLMLDLATLSDHVRWKRIQATELHDCLKSSALDVDAILCYFRNRFPPIFWNVRRAEDSVIACKVFAMPELLEIMLSHTDLFDILNMARTCKDIRNMSRHLRNCKYN